MPPTIHIVRHGEAEHNVGYRLHLPDPALTAKGMTQCRELGQTFPHMDRMTHLIASPLRRTVQTAHWAFIDPVPAAQKAQRSIVALGELQECSRHPCDVGQPLAKLAQCAGFLDVSRVEADWNSKTGIYTASEPVIKTRAERARAILRELARSVADRGDEAHLVVVSHGTLIQYLIDRPDSRKTHFYNCEYRSYKFVDLYGEDPKTAGLVETNESFYRRYGPLNMRTPEEADDLILAERSST
ncbi:hypothetical protein PG993_000360 [Apiospora rasikravindrae]|uniref:Uncharacterized protein n=1 Tax=Apiospora rasikravindrae TaxID=990691 RepID=A0ABR1U8E2_9PEZI